MGKHLFHDAFRDLLSLHGYPLPFESVERAAGAADGIRGRGDRARAPKGRSPGREAMPAQARGSGAGCVAGGCA